MSTSRLLRHHARVPKVVAGGSPGSSRVFDGLTPLPNVAVRHSSSHSLASLEREFGSMETDGDEDKAMENPGKFFSVRRSFNYRTTMTADSSEIRSLRRYCCFAMGYVHHLPSRSDKMWCPPSEGWQSIPLIFFDYGFRLPMHPFFGVIYEALGCAVAQLSPNAVVQIVGVIARCHELKELPSLELLFSIYRVKDSGGLLYLDRKKGRVRLVDAPSSHSSWHSRWTYLEGDDLDCVRPWTVVLKQRLRMLNNMSTLSDDTLNAFHGAIERYSVDDLTDFKFLSSRCCKLSVELFILWVLFLYLWLMLSCFLVVAGKPLKALVESKPKMPSRALLVKLAKRGATSMAARTPETGEKEVTSRDKTVAVVALDSDPTEEIADLVTRERGRKRIQEDAESPFRRPPQKKLKKPAAVREENVDSVAVPSYRDEMTRLKGHLDQVTSFFLLLPCSFVVSFIFVNNSDCRLMPIHVLCNLFLPFDL